MFKKTVAAIAMSSFLLTAVTPALAQADALEVAPLPAGEAAGVEEAQFIGNVHWIWVASGLIGATIILLLATGNDDNSSDGGSTPGT